MKNTEAIMSNATELLEMARQAEVELTILLGIEQSLRIALAWKTRDRGNNHKLSTLRFHTSSFERHLARVHALAGHGGYMRAVTDANPHLAGDVGALESDLEGLRSHLERIIVGLDRVSRDDARTLDQICADLESFFDDLKTHGQKECELLQHSFTQEEGGSG